MITAGMKEDLDKLVNIGNGKGGSLHEMIVSNFYAGLPSSVKTEENYNEMMRYLENKGILIISDVVEADDSDGDAEISEIRPFDPSKIDIDMKTME